MILGAMHTSFSDRTDHAPAVRAHRHIHTTALPYRNQESATATSPQKHTAQQSTHTTPSPPHIRTDARSSASTSDVKLGADAREEAKEEVKSSSKVLGRGAPGRVGGSGVRQEEAEGTSKGGGLMRLSSMDFFSADDVQGGHGDGGAALGPSHTRADDVTGARATMHARAAEAQRHAREGVKTETACERLEDVQMLHATLEQERALSNRLRILLVPSPPSLHTPHIARHSSSCPLSLPPPLSLCHPTVPDAVGPCMSRARAHTHTHARTPTYTHTGV